MQKIIKFEYFSEETLLENIRKVHIKGRPDIRLYNNAKITLKKKVNPNDITFAQYYVLEKDLNEISACRKALLEYGVDIFNLSGYVRVYSNDECGQMQVFDVLPPVVEISKADNGIPLLNDGMHRVYLAREADSTINIIEVDGVDENYPYYALPNEGGWNNLKRCCEVPDIKKNYRIQEYKKLFRDFNTAFLNVTQTRTSKTPEALKVQGSTVKI